MSKIHASQAGDESPRSRPSHEEQAAILRAAMDGFWTLDRQGRLLEANEAYARMTGYTREELLRLTAADLEADGSPDAIAAILERIKQTGGARFERRHRCKDGRLILIEASVIYLPASGGRFFCFLRDITGRKRAEEALRESEERFKGAFQHSAIGMALVSPEGRWLKINARLCAILGYAEEELLAKTFQDITHPDDLGSDLNYVRQMLAGEIETYWMEKRYFHKNGRVVWALLAVSLVRDQTGTPLYFISEIEDITERRRAGALLRARLDLSEYSAGHSLDELIQKALDEAELLTGSRIAFFHFVETDQKTLLLQTWSSNTLSHFCASEGKGRHYRVDQAGVWTDCIAARRPVIHNDYASLAHCKGLPPGHANVIRELTVPVLRGERIVAVMGVGNKSLNYDASDTETAVEFANLVWDIVQRKRTEEALRASEERYRRITEGITDYVYHVRLQDGRPVETRHGPACEMVTGYRPRDFEDDPYLWIRIVPETERGLVIECVRRLLAGESIPPFEHHLVKKGGEIRWVSDTVVPQQDASGSLLSYDGVIKDITERKRAEAEKEKLEAQNRQLQKAESLARMAGAIAHLYNNLLGAVMMHLDLAVRVHPRHDGAGENLVEAMRAARKAADVSGLMLTYLGYAPGKCVSLDLSEICRRSLPLLRAAVPQNVGVEADFSSPGPSIYADAAQIQQVLTQLVTNAWEAMDGAPGTVCLAVKTVPAEDIPAAHRFPVGWQPSHPAYVRLEVADTGCGIADQDIEQLFDPFFTRKFVGRGLGLPVVLGIARAHDGGVTVAGEPGRGSVFRVYFPVSADIPPRPPDQAVPAPELK